MTVYNVNLNAFICRAAALVLLATALASPATADVYRWVEADGTVNYGERAPQNVKYTVVSRSAPTKAGSRVVNSRGKPDTHARTTTGGSAQPGAANLSDHQKQMLSEIQAAEATRVAAVNKLRKENCATSKRTLANLQASGRIRVRDENGEESAMSEEVRSQRISEAHKSIVTNCDSLS